MTASAAAVETGLPPNVANVSAGERVGDLGRRDRPADRDAVAHSFGGCDDVRFDVPLFDAKPFVAGSAPTGLDFVGDEQTAVFAGDFVSDSENIPSAAR